jgi:DNA adenine methylase
VEKVITHLDKLARKHSEEHYYQIRHRYNNARKLAPAERAAMFVYLNKTCFNGLHRVNRSGEFNVPMGRYKNPSIVNAEALRRASGALAHATIRCASYGHLVDQAKAGDFVYFDPPYEPVSRTANFTAYSADGFSSDHQRELRDLYAALDERGCKLMLSNSDVPLIRELYCGFNIKRIYAPRAINCDSTKRGPVAEVVVRNYD